jgi:hypothetical protein
LLEAILQTSQQEFKRCRWLRCEQEAELQIWCRLNGLVIESHEGDKSQERDKLLDAENEKREVNQCWAMWNSRLKLSKQRNGAKGKDWILSEKVKPLTQHLDAPSRHHRSGVCEKLLFTSRSIRKRWVALCCVKRFF